MSTTAALEPSAQDRDRSIGRIVSVTGAKAIVLLDACGDEGQRLQVSADKRWAPCSPSTRPIPWCCRSSRP